MAHTYTQVWLHRKDNTGNRGRTAWLPSTLAIVGKILKVNKIEWKILEIYGTIKAITVEKYPKDFKVVIPDD